MILHFPQNFAIQQNSSSLEGLLLLVIQELFENLIESTRVEQLLTNTVGVLERVSQRPIYVLATKEPYHVCHDF